MTECYAQRVSIQQDHDQHCVLVPGGKKGLHPEEITIAVDAF